MNPSLGRDDSSLAPRPPPLAPQQFDLLVTEEFVGQRLDLFLAHKFPTHSRVQLRRAINAAGVSVNGKRAKAAHRLRLGEQIRLTLPEIPREAPQPENIPLDVLFEDEWLAAINKPSGMVVHPAKGHWAGTLTSALQFHFDQLSGAGGPTRPGIVHRLDRDTSGVLVVAKTDRAHFALADQFEQRTVEKEYFALVVGNPDRDRDQIDLPIGIHPYQREKMAVRRDHPTSRPAQTFYEIIERFDGFAAVRVTPKTGRTHQIRVHLNGVGCPVLCDRHYGGRSQLTRGELRGDPDDTHLLLERQALHALRLALRHPATGERLEFHAPLAPDIAEVLAELRRSRRPLSSL
ncbi:MAG TPA: RluA family pseudouridine synthase [Pirellulales bacterium]|jgi:23S rRNA pseudouridine1911/1915/1917 synthase|nr:RluA family pseudouridine synthase [Pirellulales bacterium]